MRNTPQQWRHHTSARGPGFACDAGVFYEASDVAHAANISPVARATLTSLEQCCGSGPVNMDCSKQPVRKRARFAQAEQNVRKHAQDHYKDELSSSDDDDDGALQRWLEKQAKPKPGDRKFYGISEQDWVAAGPSQQPPKPSEKACTEIASDECPCAMTNAMGGLVIQGPPASPHSGFGTQNA